MESLAGKRIVLGVTGSIAAFKAAEIASALVGMGASVRAVLTPNATQFITPVTMCAITSQDCLVGLFDETSEGEIAHISAVEQADLVVIAPATANVIGKIAHGIADDMLTTLVLAAPRPVLIVPAMNTHMWTNPVVIGNVERLKSLDYRFVDPVEGRLACGVVGVGKMASVEDVLESILNLLLGERTRDWSGVRVLITAGPTREPIDPVRYLSNYSTGRMGYAIAEAAKARGAEVVLVTGPAEAPPPSVAELVRVETAEQMLAAVQERYDSCRVVIGAAAVSDFSAARAAQKIKKPDSSEGPRIELQTTTDILAELGRRKDGHVLVGFALETEELVHRARQKLKSKNLDIIVANSAAEDNSPFGPGPSRVRFITSDGDDIPLPLMSKQEIADQLLTLIQERYLNA